MTDINLQDKSQVFFDEIKAEQAKIFFQQYNRLMAYYRCAMMEIETKFNVLNIFVAQLGNAPRTPP